MAGVGMDEFESQTILGFCDSVREEERAALIKKWGLGQGMEHRAQQSLENMEGFGKFTRTSGVMSCPCSPAGDGSGCQAEHRALS